MRWVVGNLATRRAFLDALILPALVAHPRLASAGDRVTAQTVGIDQGSPLADPRALGADKGVIWGGRERCDPTDPFCTQGGIEAESNVQPAPGTPSGLEVTDKVRFQIAVAGEVAGDLELGLWRTAAPDSVDAFMKLCSGTLISTPGDQPAAYERSVAVRVQRDKQVVLGGLKQPGGQRKLIRGQTRPQVVPVAPPINEDSNAVSHASAGLVSVRRGGGSFEFVITTRPNLERDREGLVIGQVTRGMERTRAPLAGRHATHTSATHTSATHREIVHAHARASASPRAAPTVPPLVLIESCSLHMHSH